MKKIFLLLIGITVISACNRVNYSYKSDYRYYLKETINPQHEIDSAIGYSLPKYTTWNNSCIRGVRNGDSTIICTYLYWKTINDSLDYNVSVTTFRNTDTCVIKIKPIKK